MADRYSVEELRDDAAAAARELFEDQAEDTPEESGEDIIESLRYNGRDHEAADGAIPHEYWKLGELAAAFVRDGAELDDPGLLGDDADFIRTVQTYAYEQASQAMHETLDELAGQWDAARDDAENPDSWQHWRDALAELAEIVSPAQQNYNALMQKLREAYPYSADDTPPGMMPAEIDDHHGAYLVTNDDGATLLIQGDDAQTLAEELRQTLGHSDATDSPYIPDGYAELFQAEDSAE